MDLWEVALGFMDAQALLTAEELGVFRRLADAPCTAAEVGAATGVPTDSAERLLTMLVALGVLQRTADGRYANGPEAAAQLVPGRPGYIGAMFVHLRDDLYPVWRYCGDALREGGAQWHRAFPGRRAPTAAMYDDPAALRAFLDGMHAITYDAAAQFAEWSPELRAVGTLVDVGGASGAFLIALAERHPTLQGVVYDLPPVGPVAEDRIRQAGLADRLRFAGGSFWDEPIPAGADAYSLGFVLHDWETDAGSFLLDRIAAASAPGAMLIVGEYLIADDRSGPLHVVRQDLNMLVAARGRERTAEEYRRWLAHHGFALRRVQPTSRGKHFLIAERAAVGAARRRTRPGREAGVG